MRLLWLSAEPFAPGALGVTGRVEAIRFLRSRGIDAAAICGGPEGSVAFDDVPTRFLPTRPIPLMAWASQWPQLRRELAREGSTFDVIVSDVSLLPPLMRWRARCDPGERCPKVLLDVRTPPVEAGVVRGVLQDVRFRATLARYGRRVDGITATSEGLADHVAGLARRSRADVAVWSSSGSRWSGAAPASDAAPWPEELAPSLRGRTILLYHGSISAGRGLDQVIRGLALARPVSPRLALVILGDGPAVPALRALAEDLGLAEDVTFVPPVPHDRVLAFLRVASVGVVPLPPRWEWQVSSPVKLAEYLGAGRPVVLTDIIPHRIVPGEQPFAFWAGSGGAEELSRAFVAVGASTERLPELGEMARAWAAPRLGWERQLEPLLAVTMGLVDDRESEVVTR
jgi:glycosyltransferase involved in cell wall biosynthesis